MRTILQGHSPARGRSSASAVVRRRTKKGRR